MSPDIFGNLREWSGVPDQISMLAKSRSLAEHEVGLIRILRYRQNWRLRELVLGVLDQIDTPSCALLQAVLDILADDSLYYEVRVLAAETFTKLADNRLSCGNISPDGEIRNIIDRIEAIRNRPQVPVLRSAVERCLETIRAALIHA